MSERISSRETNPRAGAEGDWGLLDILQFFWRNILILIGGVVIGLAIGLYIQSKSVRVYESKARFIVNEIPVSLDSKPMDPETDRQLVQTFILSIASSEMLSAVEKRIDSPPGSISFVDIDRALHLGGTSPKANVKIAAEKNSRLGSISAESQSPTFATAVANAVLVELELRNVIAGQIKTVDLSLKLAKAQADGILNQLVSISAERIKFEQQNLELDEYLKRRLPIENFTTFSENPSLNNLRTQMMLIESELKSLSSISTRGARLEGKKAELNGLKIQMQKEANALVVALRSQLEISKTRETNLQKELDKIQAQISALEIRGGRLLKSMSDPSLAQEALIQNSVAPVNSGNLIVVVETASPQKKPIKPKLWLNLALGVILGGGLGLLVTILRAALNNKIQNPAQIEAVTGIPCLAVLPKQPSLDPRHLVRRKVFESPPPSPGLGFLRSFLLRPGVNQTSGHLVAFVPASHSTEASNLVADLAVLLAQAEKRTLVVDLNIENPRQAGLLGTDPNKGLSDWLSSDESLDAAISYTTVRELAVISPGAHIKDLDDLLSRRPLAPALASVSEDWDFILIDSPSLHAQWHLLLALPEAGSMFITADYRQTTVPEIQNTVREADAANWSVRGFILQKYPKKNLG